VAFGKADIKELGASLLFEEWKEEEGMPLQRVWIKIFRLQEASRILSLVGFGINVRRYSVYGQD
jgi:hypothetical protein